MLVLMAIGAQQFPVAAVRRIVLVIAVFMMYFKELQIGMGEGAGAAPAHPGIELQRLRAVTGIPLVCRAARLKNHLVQPVIVLRHDDLLQWQDYAAANSLS